MKYCDNYIGVACVSGACPIAIANDPDNDFYYSGGCPCGYYKGCEDCAGAEIRGIFVSVCQKLNNYNFEGDKNDSTL